MEQPIKTQLHNKDAEEAVLASLIQEPQLIEQIAGKLTVNDFYLTASKLIYAAILELNNQGQDVNYITITNRLEEQKNLEAAGGRAYITSLETPTTAAINEYADIIRDKAVKRRLADKAAQLSKAAADDSINLQTVGPLFETIQEDIDGAARKNRTKDFKSIFQEEQQKRRTEEPAKYGITDLDKLTNGIHRGQLIVIGARPGEGKSALSLQIADNVQNKGYKVLYLPLEMTAYETLERLLIRHEYLTQEEATTGDAAIDRQQAAEDYLTKLEEQGNLIIYEGLNELDRIINKTRIEKPFLVVIDQLTQVLPGERFKDNRERYMAVTRKLKRLALDENIAILLTSQLNREATGKERAGLESLHESDSTGQDADVVVNLASKDDQEQGKRFKEVSLFLAKNRQGKSGVTIPLMFEGSKYNFEASFRDVANWETLKTPAKRL